MEIVTDDKNSELNPLLVPLPLGVGFPYQSVRQLQDLTQDFLKGNLAPEARAASV